MINEDYEHLLQLGRHSRTLQSVLFLLQWDHETHMPRGAMQARSEQTATMASLHHASKTSHSFQNALSKLIDIDTGKILESSLNDNQKAALKEWRRDFLLSKKLPNRFVSDYEKLISEASHVWAAARKEDAYLRFAPYLEQMFAKAREKAELLGFDEHPYDALLDEFEPGARIKHLIPLFDRLKKFLLPFVKSLQNCQQIDDHFLHEECSKEKTMEISHSILRRMGFQEEFSRLDFSVHPFSTALHPTDCRITTRFDKRHLKSNLGTILHEAGHGLYEMGLPQEYFGSPLCEAISLGIHESQSRFWETRIGQSLPFWEYYFPILQKAFRPLFEMQSLEQFYRAINRVEPSFIRVEADEVTYTLHIILRFEIECGLLEGSLHPRDLPDAWNAKMQEYLGITPPTHAKGCLQDIHWSSGLIGYFPTYSLGNLYASQLFDAFSVEHHNWDERIAQGELEFITHWLKREVHCHGRRYRAHELIEKISGSPLSADSYITYLTNKYSKIYPDLPSRI